MGSFWVWGSKPKCWGGDSPCGQASHPCLSWPRCQLRPLLPWAPGPFLSCSFTTTTKESHSRPFSLLPSETCSQPWLSPHTCPKPT